MQAAIDKITAAGDLRGRPLSRKTTAATELKAADKAVRMMIAQIDAVVTPSLKGNTDVLSDWNASKRIHKTAVTPIPTGTVNLPSAGKPTTPIAWTSARGVQPGARI